MGIRVCPWKEYTARAAAVYSHDVSLYPCGHAACRNEEQYRKKERAGYAKSCPQ